MEFLMFQPVWYQISFLPETMKFEKHELAYVNLQLHLFYIPDIVFGLIVKQNKKD